MITAVIIVGYLVCLAFLIRSCAWLGSEDAQIRRMVRGMFKRRKS